MVRPVLILKSFNRNSFLGVPLTTKIKPGKYYYDIDLGDNTPRQVVLSQIRFLDAKRLRGRIGIVSGHEFGKIKQALIAVIA